MTAERADNRCEECGRFTWADSLIFEDMLLCPKCMDESEYEDNEGVLRVEFTPETWR